MKKMVSLALTTFIAATFSASLFADCHDVEGTYYTPVDKKIQSATYKFSDDCSTLNVKYNVITTDLSSRSAAHDSREFRDVDTTHKFEINSDGNLVITYAAIGTFNGKPIFDMIKTTVSYSKENYLKQLSSLMDQIEKK